MVRLTVRPGPLRNNEASTTLREITVGARLRSTRAEIEAPFKAPSLAPGGVMLDLPAFDFPDNQLDGLTDQNYKSEVVTWVRFEDPAGYQWEVVWDHQAQSQSISLSDAVAS